MRLFRRTDDDRIGEEVATHLSLLEDEYRRAGMSASEARAAAERALGGELKTRQMYREASRWRWLDTFSQDARFALRLLRRDKGFAITAALVLGIGIGINNMQFTIIYTHTLRGLPIAAVERVLIGSFVDERGVDRGVSYDEYRAVESGTDLFEGLATFGGISSVALADEGRAPDRYLGVYTTRNAFDLLRIQPVTGRLFSDDEQKPGARRVAMLGGNAWRARYDNDPSVIGREVLVDGKPTVIVGILAAEPGFPSAAEVYLPIAQSPRFASDRGQRILRTFGRVRNDVTVEEAQAQLSARLEQSAPRDATNLGLRPSVGPISTRFRGRATDPAWIAFFAVGFLVVAVASANAANLMLARGVRRGRELAIRGSLGASRGRIVAQLLVESVVLAAAGGVVGVLVSLAGVRVFSAGVPPNAMPYWFRYTMDPTILVALVTVSFATVIVFGLLPAVNASRTDVSRVLKDGGWGGTGRRSARWLTTTFMVAQIALSVVLMSYVVHDITTEDDTATASDAVIDTPDVLTAAVNLPADRYSDPQSRANLLTQLQERIRTLPGNSGRRAQHVAPAKRRIRAPVAT